MVPVTVALGSLPSSDDDMRLLLAHDPHYFAKQLLAIPGTPRFLDVLRVTIIDMVGEAHPAPVVLRRAKELERPERAERIEEIARNYVRARFPARKREQRNIHTQSARQPRNRTAILVIRVRGDVEHSRGSAEPLERLMESGRRHGRLAMARRRTASRRGGGGAKKS
jgi:hypothetical protein